ncbi:MAG: phosphodiester glycosidase family protein [Actinomycetota bacterium]|nr:phosphodiester glycosidase family protein [Actinomycetota bacterium]
MARNILARKCLGAIALAVFLVLPAFFAGAFASTGRVAQSSTTLAPGVVYTSYRDSSPRNVIHVTRISAGARVVIKAVPAAADGKSGTLSSVASLCARANALACVNGDFFDHSGAPLGGELVDGRWLRQPTPIQQQLWVDTRNRFSFGAMPAHAVQSLGATNYAILRPGQAISIPEHDSFADWAHARTLVGWDAAGDRFLVTVEQNKGSSGMSLAQAADLMRGLGATAAVNEDGGGSSQMAVGGHRTGSWSRAVANIWAVVPA